MLVSVIVTTTDVVNKALTSVEDVVDVCNMHTNQLKQTTVQELGKELEILELKLANID